MAVQKVCEGCHDMEIVMDTPMDYDAWHDTIQDMINRGAKGTDAEFNMILEYLYENMTTVDVNHSDADTLRVVLNAPDETVQTIMARRDIKPFKDLSDLETIPGIDGPALEAKKRMIFFN
jgi:competence protein ComEA